MMRLLLFLLLIFCHSLYGQSKKDSLYVFIGEKIDVKSFKPTIDSGKIVMDNAFKATYAVLHNVYGNYKKDTIEFEVYDHYGVPAFSKFKNAMLFVININGKLYHEKYQYFDVYKTVDGSWASPGDPYRLDNDQRKGNNAKRAQFLEPISYDISKFDDDRIKKIFLKPYFKIEGERAIVRKGTYIDDLFNVKKEGVLKARHIFD